jgi:cell wall-associated NlpC family hydrolase
MLSGELLDAGGRGLAQAIGACAVLVVLLLGTAVVLPVLIVTTLIPRVIDSSAQPAPVPASALGVTARTWTEPLSSTIAVPPPVDSLGVVAMARRYLGVRYLFGGTDPTIGLDCSGLVQLVFRQLGISLPRTAQQQYDATLRVDRAGLQPGDLVFFARTYADPHDWVTHVGIYIGDGLQINAPTDGQVVSIQPVFSGFWGEHFAGGGRPARA